MADYADRERADNGVPLRAITRHMLGLYNGLPGARAFRRLLSEPAALSREGSGLLLRALAQVERDDDGVSDAELDAAAA
jgi:tRNA-dihydrouridine synthase A